MSNIKVCCTCSQKYKYCGHCDKNAKANRWRNSYCSENCRDIFDILMEYSGKRIPIDVAKQKLSQQNLNINIGNNVIKTYAEIMSYEEPEQEEIVRQEETIKEEVKNEEVVEEQPKPRRRRRRRMSKSED